jgi:hypothetical protein
MIQAFSNINWVAVLIASVVYFILGGLWFWKPVFGNRYDDAIGFNRPGNWKWSSIYFTVPFLSCSLVSTAVGVLANLVAMNSLADKILFGLVLGIGFSLSISLVNSVTPKMPKPIKFGLITGCYHIAGIILVVLIITAI